MIADGSLLQIFQRFFERHGTVILHAAGKHMILSVAAMLIACSLAIPLGILLSRCRNRHLANGIIGIVSIIQPIPSLAFVAITAVVFAAIDWPTIGWSPALVALVAYALLPILRNTHTGIQQVDPTVKEVARGMGMKPMQILLNVELPVAMPFIITGIRIATVWTIGVATLVSLVGAGGLGDLIFQGLDTNHMDMILAGALPAAALALSLDGLLSLLERWLTPKGLRSQRANP
jgi:osmoprotectant transport system permease protein